MKMIELGNPTANQTSVEVSAAVAEETYVISPPPKRLQRFMLPTSGLTATYSLHSVVPAEASETQFSTVSKQPLTISDLGWTQETAAQIRASLSHFAEDWDDPAMDVYDEL